MRLRLYLVGFALTAVAFAAPAAWTAPPTITNLSLRGLQAGSTAALVVDGADLLPDPHLVSSLAGLKATVKPGATANRVELELNVDAGVSPGIYALRLASGKGISSAVLVGIDGLPQLAGGAKGADMQLATLPAAITGNLAGGEVDRFTFTGQVGQRLVIDVEARRLGANFNPVVRLYDARGTQVAFAQAEPRLAGDPRIVTTLKSAGTYIVELQDLAYRAGAPGFYRLKLGDLNFADFALPAGITAGAKGALHFVSSSLPPAAESLVETPAGAVQESFFAIRPPAPLLTGQAPRVFASEHAEILEAPRTENPQELPPAPMAVSGVVSVTGEEDRFLLPVIAGKKLRFEVLAAPLGSPLDAVLTLASADGNQLATDDDQPGSTDPSLEFTVPANMSQLLVKVADHQRLGGPDFVYRLVVRAAGTPEFSLTLDRDRVNIPTGGVEVVRVDAARSGYNGPIALEVQNLPPGVQVSGAEIPAGAGFTLLSILAPPGVNGSGLVALIGRATAAQPPLVRRALVAETPATRLAPWLRQDVGVGITDSAQLAVNWTLTPEEKLPLGGKYTAKLALTRATGVTGAVRFQMLTTQPAVKKKEKKNFKEVDVDDVMKMLRLENPPELDAKTNEATLTVVVPAELAAHPWGLAFTAELLDGEKKNVVATATTGMKFLPAVKPPETKTEKPAETKTEPASAEKKADPNAGKGKEKTKEKPAKPPKPKNNV